MAKEKKTIKAIIPQDEFQRVYALLPESEKCAGVWCSFSRTTCHVRECRDALCDWWKRTNGNAPGFVHYEQVFENAIHVENALYWCFWTEEMKPCEELYEALATAVRNAFAGKPLDKRHSWQ